MKEKKSERVPVMLEPGLLKQIDEYSFENRIRTRAATIRKLILEGMNVSTEKADAPRAS
ncbi:hypothetical protein QD336_05275 [Rhizobium sp. BR 250]